MSNHLIRDKLPTPTIPKGLATILRACLRSLLVMVVAASFSVSGQDNKSRNEEVQISIRLSIPKNTFTVGESVKVKVHISNVGNKPVLVENFLSTSRNAASHIKFLLKDNHGRRSPSLDEISDSFLPRMEVSPAIALLRSWLLLYPECSLVVDVPLDRELFAFLGKPGKYKLSGTYFSSGLLYPSTYRNIGLTEEDVRSLPFQSWGGHISTNTLNLEIVPVKP